LLSRAFVEGVGGALERLAEERGEGDGDAGVSNGLLTAPAMGGLFVRATPKAMSAYVGLRIASLDEEMEGELGAAEAAAAMVEAASLLLSPFASALLRKGTSFLGVGAGVVVAGAAGEGEATVDGVAAGVGVVVAAAAGGGGGVVVVVVVGAAGVGAGDVGGGLFWDGHSRTATPGAATTDST
jgi:hypothetical protein